VVRKISAYVVWAALVLCSAAVCPAGADGQSDEGRSIETAQQAVRRAYEYTGFTEIKDLPPKAASEIAELITVESDETPFLSDSVVGCRAWQVWLNNVWLNSEKWDQAVVQQYNPKNFIVLLDSATGRLFKVYSKFDGHDPDLAPEPPADTAAVLMRMSGEEYVSFPADPPPVSFFTALGSAAGSNPLQAREIIAVYVLYSDTGNPTKPCWCITGRGIPPLDLFPNSSRWPAYMRNRMRSIVDATTGEFIGMTTSPPVMVRDEDRR